MKHHYRFIGFSSSLRGVGILAALLIVTGKSASADPIPYSTMQVINEGDSDAAIAEKAAKVLPRPNQTAWMRLERTFFLHFGVNTFNEVEWGSGREEPAIFNPTELDANQWLDAIEEFRRQDDRACLQTSRWILHVADALHAAFGRGQSVA